MPILRTIDSGDAGAFAQFERDNREAYEHFHEPQAEGYYSNTGLREAFYDMLALQQVGLVHTFLLVERGDAGQDHWLGKGALILGNPSECAASLVAYQIDHRHWGKGLATRLLQELVTVADALGRPCMEAVVTSTHIASMRLLLRHRFNCVGKAAPAVLRSGVVSCLWFRRDP
jgi:RimJ/RimL family protein N-acetyltransferase